jgi:hypothetical protein
MKSILKRSHYPIHQIFMGFEIALKLKILHFFNMKLGISKAPNLVTHVEANLFPCLRHSLSSFLLKNAVLKPAANESPAPVVSNTLSSFEG